MKVYFVGAGPGDPELITVKGQRLLAQAGVVIYAGSLVNPALLAYARPDAQVYNSAGMTLPEVLAVIKDAVQAGRLVVRLHTGDPSLYGAVQEQIDALAACGIACEMVPGVSSFLAAAAALRQEYTLPGVSQTVIITRQEGRTAVPERERLRLLAAHQATMCIFLSVHLLPQLVTELLAGGYPATTPVAIVEKASWPEERVIRSTLADVTAVAAEAGLTRTALVVVGACLAKQYTPSRLYDPQFSHLFRTAR